MKSHTRSPGKPKTYVFLVLLCLVGGLLSCASPQTNNYHESDPNRPIVDDKYRLTADREQLAEMRAQVPPEKKTENDEIAFIMQLLADPSKEPSPIHDKFDSTLSRKREKFSKDIQRERDEFTKNDHKDREVFLKQMDEDRKEFLKSKHGKDDRDDFFNKQEERRKDYFENQRERRSDFEADVSERRRDFEDYARGKSAEFMQEYRAFQHRHEDYLKQKEKEKKDAAEARQVNPTTSSAQPQADPEVKSFLQEFMDIPAAPGTNLESGD